MSISFALRQSLIFVDADLSGPLGVVTARLALDTGATYTTLTPQVLRQAGYDPAAAAAGGSVWTANGQAAVRRLTVDSLTCLEHTERRLEILAHPLTRPGLDGLLGLNFFRDRHLALDFRRGRIRFGVKNWWRFWL